MAKFFNLSLFKKRWIAKVLGAVTSTALGLSVLASPVDASSLSQANDAAFENMRPTKRLVLELSSNTSEGTAANNFAHASHVSHSSHGSHVSHSSHRSHVSGY